jgi:PST family polysaccharide transporter
MEVEATHLTEAEAPSEGLTKRAVRGTVWSAMSTAGKQVLTLASVATVARMLGPEAYGIIGMAAIITGFINNFRDLGTAVAIIQRPSISRRLLSSLFWINIGIGALMCGLVVLTSPAAAVFFKTPELSLVLRVLAVSFLIASAGVVHNALLNRAMSFRALAIVDLGAATLTYLTALICAYRGLGVWALVFANVMNSTASTLGYWIAQRFFPRVEFDATEVRSIAKFSLNLSGFGLVNYGCRNADNLTVGRVLGSAPLGIYQMAYNLMMTPLQNISSVIAQVLFPAFSRIQDDDERFRNAYIRGCMLIGLVTFPVMAGLGVLADPLIRALLKEKWIATVPVFQILAPVGLVQSVQSSVGIIYQAKGRTEWMFRWSIVVLLLTVPAFIIGAHFGVNGVAAGYAIAYFVVLLFPTFAIPFRLIGLRVSQFVKALAPQLLVTVCMTVCCFLWLVLLRRLGVTNDWVRLLSGCALGAAVYITGLLVFRLEVVRCLHEVLHSSDNPVLSRFAGWIR